MKLPLRFEFKESGGHDTLFSSQSAINMAEKVIECGCENDTEFQQSVTQEGRKRCPNCGHEWFFRLVEMNTNIIDVPGVGVIGSATPTAELCAECKDGRHRECTGFAQTGELCACEEE